MEQRILEVIRKHPGIRKRYIACELRCTVFDLLDAMTHLRDEGLIRNVLHNDFLNMEYYDMWYAVE